MTESSNKKGFDIDVLDLSNLFPAGAGKEKADTKPASSDDKKTEEKIPLTDLSPEDDVNEIIEALFNKMRKKGDFPTFSKQITDVNMILNTRYSSVKDIAEVITKDFSLTNKLLKLVNSSFYGQFNKNGVSSVKQAMVIMGTNLIQQAAASLMLFEHMQANAQNQDMKEMAAHTFMSGLMAKDLARLSDIRDTEEFQICAMFHSLGENLIAFYFPEKHRRIKEIESKHGLSKEQSSHKILGITYRELGIGIARKWGIPDNVIKSMEFEPDHVAELSEKDLSRNDFLGAVASFTNAVSEIQLNADPEARNLAIGSLLKLFKDVLDLNMADMDGVLKRVTDKIKAHAVQLNINTGKTRFMTNMEKEKPKRKTPAKTREQIEQEIKKKIDGELIRIDNKMKGAFELSDILSDIVKTMHREFDFDRIAICIKDPGTNMMKLRYGLGKDIDAMTRDFYFPVGKGQDIFHLCMDREKDYSIHDINDPKYKALIPSWFRQINMAKGFEIIAIVVNHVALGFFYADWSDIKEYTPFEQQKGMKKLRSLAEKAIRLKKGVN